MVSSNKINSCGLVMLRLLQLLYEENATYDNVVEMLKEVENTPTINNAHVQLNKYLNVLKVLGIDVIKENNAFRLANSLFSIEYTTKEIKALSIMASMVKNIPDQILSKEMKSLIKTFEVRMSADDRRLLRYNIKHSAYEFSCFFTSYKEQIRLCEQICSENFMVNITYMKNTENIICKCNPKEVEYFVDKAILKVYDLDENEFKDILVKDILLVTKLPQMVKPFENKRTVVYKLKNKLAKRYRIKENEHIDGYDSEGNLIVINQGENSEKLIKRLFRYAQDCEIISPKLLRKEMVKLINDAINNYKQ